MEWILPSVRTPKPYVRVWLVTDAGVQTTGYISSNGSWVFLCKRVAATNPTVARWRE